MHSRQWEVWALFIAAYRKETISFPFSSWTRDPAHCVFQREGSTKRPLACVHLWIIKLNPSAHTCAVKKGDNFQMCGAEVTCLSSVPLGAVREAWATPRQPATTASSANREIKWNCLKLILHFNFVLIWLSYWVLTTLCIPHLMS